MTVLGVQGDPDGWTNAGYTIRAAASQLAEELDSADASGGSGLRRSWHGPMSDAYQDLWNRRYGRYGDLTYQAGRAATALISFGEALIGLQQRAADLERQWLGLGLHLSADGVSFALPFGHESLAQEAQATLHAFLGESERDVEAMWTDIRAAVSDVVTVLKSVSDALEDFLAIAAGVDAAVAGYVVSDFLDWKTLPGNIHSLAQLSAKELRYAADSVGLDAWFAEKEGLADTGATQAKLLNAGARADEVEGGVPGLVVANVATAAITTYEVTHGGWYKAMVTDKDASLVAGTATDDAIVVVANLIPGGQVVDTPIGTAVSGVVSIGVGAVAQWTVDAAAKDPKLVTAGLRDFASVTGDVGSLL